MEMEKLEFREAVQILAKEAGVELRTDYSREKGEKNADIYALYRTTTEWYHQALFLPENAHAMGYLNERNISRESIEKFSLGYSHAPRDLFFHLKDLWFEEKTILESGIFVSTSRDKFFRRITFPIANFLGHVVAFTARVLDTSLPKYLNSPVSNIFDKSSILYGLHLAKWPASKLGSIIIVEWQMDTIALHQAGYDHAVGISGTALTANHIKILKRFTKKIYLSLDHDNAGINATFSSIESTMNEDIDVRIISIPNGKDPDWFIQSGGDFQTCLDTARSPIDFFMHEWKQKFDITAKIWKKQLLDYMLNFVSKIKSLTEREMYIDSIAKEMWISRHSLDAELQIFEKKISNVKSAPVLHNSENFREMNIWDIIAGYMSTFSLFDLFSQEFRYTLDDLAEVRDFSLLTSLLLGEVLDEYKRERLILAELRAEEEWREKTESKRRETFLQLITKLHAELFQDERDRTLSNVQNDDPEYLALYSKLLNRAKSLGLSQQILQK